MSKEKLSIFLLGDSGVGKTAICKRFKGEDFPEKHNMDPNPLYPTQQKINLQKTPVDLVVWEVNGWYGSIRSDSWLSSRLKKPDVAVVIVLDCSTAQKQQEAMTRWVKEVEEILAHGAFLYFLANKTDDESAMLNSREAAIEWIKTNAQIKNPDGTPIPFFWCSAKANIEISQRNLINPEQGDVTLLQGLFHPENNKTGIRRLFENIANEILARQKNPGPEQFQKKEVTSFDRWKKLADIWKKHKIWIIVNLLLLAGAIMFLILAATFPPVSAALALGGMSALAISGSISGVVIAVGNVFCAIGNSISNKLSRSEVSGSSVEDRFENRVPYDLVKSSPPADIAKKQVAGPLSHMLKKETDEEENSEEKKNLSPKKE